MKQRNSKSMQKRRNEQRKELPTEMAKPDWSKQCECCGASPVLPATGMCGPCTFGEADTAGGNW